MSVAIHTALRVPTIDWTDVPAAHKGKCSAVCRTAEECGELVRWFGSADFCPTLPVMVMVPGGPDVQPVMIAGMGYASAAELQDCAIVTWHQHEEKGGKIFDFDALRESRGLMRREDVDAAARDAFTRRIAEHKANLRTDPFRVPQHQNPTEKTVFGSMPGKGDLDA